MRCYLVIGMVLLAIPAWADSTNNGEDITRPITRFDIRLKTQTGASDQNGNAFILTFRSDKAIPLKNHWQLALRADAPLEFFYCPCHNCDSCKEARRMGDTLLQVFLITPNVGKWSFGVGTKFIFPTAGDNLEIGDGKYQIFPSLAFRYDLNQAYIGAIMRHAWSVGGYSSAPFINQTYIQPFFNLNLPHDWFINSSPELFYDWPSHHWFVPIDLMIGKMITKKIIVSLEYEYGIIHQYPEYIQQVEFRIGVFF